MVLAWAVVGLCLTKTVNFNQWGEVVIRVMPTMPVVISVVLNAGSITTTSNPSSYSCPY